ncbi:MAG: ABC transporter ATP-binding protein [Alphaproteobacteria bacterium]|nr:ABC transporter ATP-binding protein [Alphaproteobacteria bacterium]
MAAPIAEIEALHLSFRSGGAIVQAVRGASLAVAPGEAVGLVGESGSGKSTVARALLGLNPPSTASIDGGAIRIAGADVTRHRTTDWERLRGHPLAMVFQDPLSALNPVMRVGRQIAESVRRHDSAAALGPRVAELLELVRLPPATARAYPHELSGGMRQRAVLAIALGCRPALLIADEPTTALDVTTQAEIMALLQELRERTGMAMLLISHDLALVASACARIYVMYAGRTIEWGATARVFGTPAHPYTRGLLQAALAERDASGRFATMALLRPEPVAPDPCPFVPRCPVARADCTTMPAPTGLPATDHTVCCWEAHRG